MRALNVEQIQEIIPHRHPFLLVDAIEDFEPGEFAVGYKCVTYREEFFRGHFPKKACDAGSADFRSSGAGWCSRDLKRSGKSGEDCIFRRRAELQI